LFGEAFGGSETKAGRSSDYHGDLVLQASHGT
jgi:hypothetical protein